MHSVDYDINSVCKKWPTARLFYSEDDPGDEFEMSEWFDIKQKPAPYGLLLVKQSDNDIFKAFHFSGNHSNWCTWDEGYKFSGGLTHWAYIRKLSGENRKDVDVWTKVKSEKRMSN